MRTLLAFVAVLLTSLPALSDPKIEIHDAYARTSGHHAKSAAAFFHIMNHGDEGDRLVEARSSIAKHTELHTHHMNADGVMKMMKVEEGFTVPANGMHMLKRGGDHVMFMGLTTHLNEGDQISLDLVFEKSGVIHLELPIKSDGDKEMSHDHEHGHKEDKHSDH